MSGSFSWVSIFKSAFRGETQQRDGFDFLPGALPAPAHFGTIDRSKVSGRGGLLCPKTRRILLQSPKARKIRAPTRNYLPRSTRICVDSRTGSCAAFHRRG